MILVVSFVALFKYVFSKLVRIFTFLVIFIYTGVLLLAGWSKIGIRGLMQLVHCGIEKFGYPLLNCSNPLHRGETWQDHYKGIACKRIFKTC